MHELLERNTDGTLNEREQVEVKALAEMAQFAQVVAMAMAVEGRQKALGAISE